MRFAGIAFVADPEKYATAVLKGDRINKMKATSGQQMTDAYLADRLQRLYPNLKEVYRQTSGLINLSDRHIFQMINSTKNENRTVRLLVTAHDTPRPPTDYIEILAAFDAGGAMTVGLIAGWIDAIKNRRTPS